MDYRDCHKPENHHPLEALRLTIAAIRAVHAAFGAPGDYGYDTKEGEALHFLYDLGKPVGAAIQELKSEATHAQ